MAGLKQIRLRLTSVKNTRQITRAMKLVSAAKLTRAQEAVTKSRGYSGALAAMLQRLVAEVDLSDIEHPLMQPHESVKNVRVVVVGGGRGLCGAFNSNVNKQIVALYKRIRTEHPNAEISATILGRKPAEFCRREGLSYVKSYEALPENPNAWPLEEVTEEIENAYAAGAIDQVYLVYTSFRSVMTQVVQSELLMPFAVNNSIANEAAGGKAETTNVAPASVTTFEPSAKEVFSGLIPRLIRVKLRQACLDSKASEHASRMTAMDSATKNAGELIDKLGLLYNRLRQSGITSQLLDIVGGAEAQNQ